MVKSRPCCSSKELSIFFGGAEFSKNLVGVKSHTIDVWFKNITDLKFAHIRKDDDWK